eukprot:gnl/MRDRNA2_/MRDRNA2_145734_c0_seq1.p1 gnl/MRDRNA2_/MRDRNA2_145734_c0~~gnl/MRDRNA2_/MRDRNA2_145734_c0_seq1.p1  ORF type:complete len:368 (+),score=60.75 gnl/MRDRNA2_/MRDRNA2_145734_c0_seq1:65-1168(+)
MMGVQAVSANELALMPSVSKPHGCAQFYLANVLNPFLDDLMTQLRQTYPDDPLAHMKDFASSRGTETPSTLARRPKLEPQQLNEYLSQKVFPLIVEFTYQCLKSRPANPCEALATFVASKGVNAVQPPPKRRTRIDEEEPEFFEPYTGETFEDVLSRLVDLPKDQFHLTRIYQTVLPNFLARSLVFVQLIPRPLTWTPENAFSANDAARWQILADYPWHDTEGASLSSVVNPLADNHSLYTSITARPLCYPLDAELRGQGEVLEGEMLEAAHAAPTELESWTCEICDSIMERSEDDPSRDLGAFCLICGSHWNPGDDSWNDWKNVWKCGCGTVYWYGYAAGNARCGKCDIFRPIVNLLNVEHDEDDD